MIQTEKEYNAMVECMEVLAQNLILLLPLF